MLNEQIFTLSILDKNESIEIFNELNKEEIYDLNDELWNIYTENGYPSCIIEYAGDKYFKRSLFCIRVFEEDECEYIKNTGCILIAHPNLSLTKIKNLIRKNYTDDIWDSMESLIENIKQENYENPIFLGN